MNKHAYLIMCHNNFNILMKLIDLINDERNDIYIHVDQKSKNFPYDKIKTICTKSNIEFVNSIEVNWGGFSQIEAELILLKASTKTHHSFYHLISGVDMPLMTRDEIYSYFEKQNGQNIVSFDNIFKMDEVYLNRIKYYYFFQDRIGRNEGKLIYIYYIMQNLSLKLQEFIKIDRTKKIKFIQKGPQWFSISEQLAKFIIDQEDYIRKNFNYGICVDEMFLQTLIVNSSFKDNVVNKDLRYIDWKRGTPYTFRKEDFNELIHSGKLFARKFDENIDMEIVNMIYNYLKNKEESN